jgi:hypothetical protein
MTTVKVISTAGVLLALLAISTDAFSGPRQAEAERELKITQSVIEKVHRLVDESENRRAEEALKRAIEVQGRAMREFRGNALRSTVRLTLVARDYAKRAAKLAGELSENREFVGRQLERTRDILRKAREQARDAGEVRVRDLLRTAFERQEQAESAFREHQFRVSLRMTQLARELAHRALEMVRGEPGASPDRVRNAIERTDEVLGRVSRELEGHRPPLLDEAFRLQDRAEAQLGEARFAPALKLTLTARDLAQRAVRERDGPGGIAREIEVTRELLARADRVAEESGSDPAKILVREARLHLEKAEAHFRGEEYVAARAQMKLARRTAERALEAAGGI